MTQPAQALAIGLIHHRADTPAIDRAWTRAVVIRHARDLDLQLVDIVETDEVADAGDDETLQRLTLLARSATATSLVTGGVRPDLGARIANDLGLRHEPDLPPVAALPPA